MRVEITVEGANQLIARFAQVEKGLDFRELGTWDAVASEFYKIEKEQFDSEGGAGKSGKWKALKPEYAKRKQKKWGNVPILHASGEMMRSLTSRNAPGAVLEKTADELTLGTINPKALYHHGNKRAKGVPQRKVVDPTDAQVDRLSKVIQGKMKQLIANAKLRDIRGF